MSEKDIKVRFYFLLLTLLLYASRFSNAVCTFAAWFGDYPFCFNSAFFKC